MQLGRCERCHKAISYQNDSPPPTYCSECVKLESTHSPAAEKAIVESQRQGAKDDGGKLQFWIPIKPLMEVQKVFHFGANKYGPTNWRKGFKYTRCLHAMFRHFFAWLTGETNDSEHGCHHLASVCFYMLVLMDFDFEGIGIDDRYELYPHSDHNRTMRATEGVKL